MCAAGPCVVRVMALDRTMTPVSPPKCLTFMNLKGGQVPVFGVRRQAPVRQRGSVSHERFHAWC
jgi:hypothetical protein